MDNRKIIGTRINSALAFANKKQKDLAAHLGVPDNTISYFCSGKRVPNAEQIIKISEFLKVSSDYILGLNENPSTNPDITNACNVTGLDEITVRLLITQMKNWEIMFGDENKTPKILNKILSSDEFMNICTYISELQKISELSCSLKNDNIKTFNKIQFLLETDWSFEEIEKKYPYQEYKAVEKEYFQLDDTCDVIRYKSTKFFEKLLNLFDAREYTVLEKIMTKEFDINVIANSFEQEQREQVNDNGKHNPPKE
ncbi:MAG: helix-turn-helix transcriptional regulator [Oscillospiraceae bacterium]|nr:helix-turn-helix transcriptional regulator [Oscillospiraceae bacterium]